jgi:hypothetical protein
MSFLSPYSLVSILQVVSLSPAGAHVITIMVSCPPQTPHLTHTRFLVLQNLNSRYLRHRPSLYELSTIESLSSILIFLLVYSLFVPSSLQKLTSSCVVDFHYASFLSIRSERQDYHFCESHFFTITVTVTER